MGAFEHVISLLSFVFALAIAHLLLTVAGFVRSWERVELSWPHALWLLNGLITVLANWISFWDMRTLTAWSIGTILFTFALAFLTYLQVALVCPEIPAEGAIDLKRFHDKQSRRYIGAFAVTSIMALIGNVILGDGLNVQEWGEQNLAVVPMIAVTLPALFLRNRWVQLGSPLALMAIWLLYFARFQAALH
ncbi:MAG TPA: hypothetical protein VNU97_03885 [Rhizomicrobium sp.]|jgi:hypothetical protein|nr:hypothetical protein [Rhizomicrobium sp.]